MENLNIPPFYVGQEVVSVWNHSQGDFKKGDEFKVLAIKKGCCRWLIQIGIKPKYERGQCTKCLRFYQNEFYSWYNHERFNPKIEIAEFISMKQLADQQLEIIGAN